MSDNNKGGQPNEFDARFTALEQRFDSFAAKVQSAMDDMEAEGDPGADVSALKKRVSDLTSKYREAITANRELLEGLGTVKSEHDQFRQSSAQALEAALQAEREQHTQALEQFQGMHAQHLQLSDLGIREDLGRKAVGDAFGALPEDKRGEADNAASWWSQIVETQNAHLADPENVAAPSVPRTLLGYLPAPGAPDKVGHVSTERNRAPTKTGQVTPADIIAASKEGPEAYRAVMERYKKQLAGG